MIKLASSLSLKEGVAVEQRHFELVMSVADRFRKDLQAAGVELDHIEEDLTSSKRGLDKEAEK